MRPTITTYEDWITLLNSAEMGENTIQYEVGLYYDFGLTIGGVEITAENKIKAFEWYNKAYNHGNSDAMVRVADFLSEGKYRDLDEGLAIQLYEKGIANGSSIAANNLATIFRDKHDYKKAFELYKIAQSIDKSNSLELAICYYYGLGTKKNLKTGYEILLEISQDTPQGSHYQCDIDEANYLLGKIFLDGDIVEISLQKARYFLLLADADNDHPSAQHLLALIGRN